MSSITRRSATSCAKGITGLAVVAGDKHTFWAGRVSKALPPRKFEPVGVEFITGSISAQGLFEVTEHRDEERPHCVALYLQDRPDGRVAPAMNMTVLHGVRASLELQRSGNNARALALSNPTSRRISTFADLGGHGYATVRVTADMLETEFVCIPRPSNAAARRTADRSAIGSSTASRAGRGANGRGSSSKLSKGRRRWRRRQIEAADRAISRLVSSADQNLRPRPAMTCERLPSITRAASGLAKSRSL